ncbi:ABC transporter permease [Spirillospora sp. NPDC127200]
MNALTGTGTLLRLALRRDRIMIPVWTLLLASLVVSTVSGYAGLYGTEAERVKFAEGVNANAATLAFYGEVHATSVGALSAWRMGTLAGALVGVMTLLLVIRHTRAEEEDGRLELVGAGAVGRRAPLTAALLAAVAADAAVSVLAGLALAGQGAAGALAFGLSWFANGLVFAAVAAVAAQATENARPARGTAVAAIGVAFLVRAVGDATDGGGWLLWLSPIGWSQQVRPYAGDRFWVLLLPLALAVLLVALAYRLAGRRDLGAGLLPPRLGPAAAGPGLRSALALAWRMQRGSLASWTGAVVVYGLVFGGVLEGVGDLVGDSRETTELITELGGASGLTDAFLATLSGIMGLVAAVYGVQATLRLRGEETSQRLEPLLALSLGRVRWAGGHLLIAMAGVALLLASAGLATGLAYGATTGDMGGKLPEAFGAVFVQLPAAWVLTGLTAALFGLLPRYTPAAWGALGVFVVLGLLGPALDLDQAVMDLSPFSHVPKLPSADLAATPLVVLGLVVAALTAAGLAGFRRRDITA